MDTQTKMTEQITLDIEGMSCSGCCNSVENTLSNLEGVTQAEVDLDNGSASVSYDPDKVTIDDFRNAVDEAGYEVAATTK